MSQLQATTISEFLGVNKSATETQLKLGEASTMKNWIITDDLKLKKMFGYVHLITSMGAHKINGMWYGSINGTYHFLFACNGHIYELNLTTNTYSDLGTIVDAFPTTIFLNNNTVYIMDGTEMYSWGGSGSVVPVVGYVPTVFTAAPPSGGGTILESLNYITGKKTMKFSGDNTSTVYQLAETNIDSVDAVYVNGVLKTVGTDYTVSLSVGTVTFITKPPTGVNNVPISWTKTVAGDRQTITKNMYYGGMYYARIWIYGNPNHLNTRYPSGVTSAGVSDPTYWPKFSDSNVGEHEITGIETQYNKQLIYTDSSSWYSEEEDYTDPTTHIITALFPVYPMSSKVGNVAKGQTRVIVNNPFTIYKGMFQWVSTYVLDEKNAEWMSKRIQSDLDSVDLRTALTVDWDNKGWYILAVGSTLWVYSYRVDMFFILNIPHTPTCFCVVNGQLYFGTADGIIHKFDETTLTYDGAIIDAEWEMGFFNFGVEWIQKFIQRIFVSLNPEAHSRVDITYSTDRSSLSETKTAYYNLLDFAHIDFSHFSFLTSRNPQPFKFKIKAKKIDYFKLKLTSNTAPDSATILSLTIPSRTGAEIKKRS